MRRPLVQILLALGLLLLVNHFWTSGGSSPEGQAPGQRNGKTLPTSYIDNARSRSYAEDGTLSDILEAERVEQYGRNAYSLLTQPRFYAHTDNDRTWSARADRGRFETGRQRLLLRNNVVLTHDQTGTRLDSRTMDIHLDSREARSRTPVTITQAENQTRADGMLARLNQETVTLGPNVESIYVQTP